MSLAADLSLDRHCIPTITLYQRHGDALLHSMHLIDDSKQRCVNAGHHGTFQSTSSELRVHLAGCPDALVRSVPNSWSKFD